MGHLHLIGAQSGCGPCTGLIYPDVCTLGDMAERNPLDELRERIDAALRASPAKDVEKNLNALLAAFFDRFDLAAREDLDVHRKLLERAQAKLAALEARVAELESRKPGR